MVVEVCLAGVESAVSAQAGGATRIELCENLAEGGTTPSPATIALTCEKLSIPVHVMIRPRGGDFCYSDLEFAVMRRDVVEAVSLNAAGVVFGLLTQDGEVDMKRTQELIDLARPLSVTFHRAFDVASNPFAALDDLLALGVDRLLTSGQQATAWQGRVLIQELVERVNGRLHIMAGSGINASNAAPLIAATGITEIHVGSACAEIIDKPETAVKNLITPLQHVSAKRVRQIVKTINLTPSA